MRNWCLQSSNFRKRFIASGFGGDLASLYAVGPRTKVESSHFQTQDMQSVPTQSTGRQVDRGWRKIIKAQWKALWAQCRKCYLCLSLLVKLVLRTTFNPSVQVDQANQIRGSLLHLALGYPTRGCGQLSRWTGLKPHLTASLAGIQQNVLVNDVISMLGYVYTSV